MKQKLTHRINATQLHAFDATSTCDIKIGIEKVDGILRYPTLVTSVFFELTRSTYLYLFNSWTFLNIFPYSSLLFFGDNQDF